MKPIVTILGKEFPTYGICFWIAIVLCVVLAVLLCKKRGLDRDELMYSAVFTFVGAFLGAKLLFLAISMPQIIEAQVSLEAVIKGGFVFYGGLIGGAFGLWLYAKIFHMDLLPFLHVYAMVLPLGHAIGRVGCFFGGCCYGIPYDGPLSHTYTMTISLNTPLGVPLFPVQLLEAACLVVLFGVSLFLFLKFPKKRLLPLQAYLFAYPVIRFSLEFLRGDSERGLLLGLATSQWVSIGLFLIAIAIVVKQQLDKRKKLG